MWIFSLLIFQFAVLDIQATNYRLEHEGVEVTYYNKDYVLEAEAKLFQYNGTSKAYNLSITLLRDIPSDFKVSLQPYKFQANAYRRFPYEFAPKVCNLFARNDFGIRSVYNYSNFRGCPVKANVTYYVTNFILDDRKIPRSAMIPGKFKVDGAVLNKTVTYGKFEWFVSVVPANH